MLQGEHVLLVRHTYVDGWHLPGGGVSRGESFQDALVRELREECALTPKAYDLFGVYYSDRTGKRDHIAIFVVRQFEAIPGRRPDGEILESGFFDLKNLPNETSVATRRRVAEFLGEPISSVW